MADRSKRGERRTGRWARLFVALDLPPRVRAAIARWGAGALGDPALRPVSESSLHITCAFLGSRPCEEIDAIAAVVRASAAPAPMIVLGEPEPRPRMGRAKVYALPVRSEGAVALRASLVERLVAAGFLEPDDRPFWPHVTLARVRAEGSGSRRPMRVSEPPRGLPEALSEPFESVRLGLYLSELQPRGARYVPLANVELPGQGSSEVI